MCLCVGESGRKASLDSGSKKHNIYHLLTDADVDSLVARTIGYSGECGDCMVD